jgi:ABC-type proline/glycine betaine transport system permease subunit
MLAAHAALAIAAIGVAVLAALAGGIAYRRRREPGGLVRHLLALAQTLLIAQVGLGLLLLSDDRRAPDDLHYVYGTLALGAVLAPWLYAPREPRRRLAWFAGATLLAAALATRAYTTGG